MLEQGLNDVLTIIPAKLGSTRLPRKNILPLAGKPLLAYPVEAALASGVCGYVMVSTESEEVAEFARRAGAEVPFMRPASLGADPCGVVDVCLNVLDTFEEGGITFSRLIILLPTAPFTRAEDIRGASVFFDSGNALFLQSVSEYREDIFSALEFVDREAGKVRPVFPDFAGKKRHELPVAYEANGAITIVDVKSFRSQKTYFGTPLCAYRMPRSRRVDIDTAEDFEYAEYLMSKGDPSV